MTQEQAQAILASCQQAMANNTSLGKPLQFYSKHCAGLVLCVNKGRMVATQGGGLVRMGEKTISFSPIASVKTADPIGRIPFGFFQSADPEIVSFLVNRILEKGDVCGPEEYEALSTPSEVQLLKSNARTIEISNRLDQVLAENEALKRKLAAAAVPAGKGGAKDQATA